MLMRRNEIRMKRNDFIFIVVAIFLVGAILGISFMPARPIEEAVEISEYSVVMGIPAVDAENNGVVGTLFTTVKPGTGRILVNVDNILSQIDTQFSSRTAVKAATDYMKVDPGMIDVIFTLKVNATIIEGPSAGSAMAASVILALSGSQADSRIMMTGTIEDSGIIGTVGAIDEKARAAKAAGAEIFIVPSGQSEDTISKRERECTEYGSVTVCNVRYVREKVSVSGSLNMTIVEAGTIEELMKLYYGMRGDGVTE